jgi:argininosuccinate lyase
VKTGNGEKFSESKVIEQIGVDTGGQMHVARSRNDLVSAIDHLRARALCLQISEKLLALRETMITCGDRRYSIFCGSAVRF